MVLSGESDYTEAESYHDLCTELKSHVVVAASHTTARTVQETGNRPNSWAEKTCKSKWTGGFPHCSPVAAVSVEPGWVNCMTRHYPRPNVPQRPTETFVWCSLMERDASLCECEQRLTDWMWRKQTMHGWYLAVGLSVACAHFCFVTVPFSASLNIFLSQHVDDGPQVMYFTVT